MLDVLRQTGWEVQHLQNEPAVQTLSGRKAAILDARPDGAQPLARALFWDTDILVLPAAARYLHAMWAYEPNATVLAKPEIRGCFNSGLMMFTPSVLRKREYERLIAHKPIPRRCPTGRFDRTTSDQGYLNALYSDQNPFLQAMRAQYTGDDARETERYFAYNTSRYTALPDQVFPLRTSFSRARLSL